VYKLKAITNKSAKKDVMFMLDSVFEEQLRKRQEYLEQVILQKQEALRNIPDGKLRIVHRGRQDYYYHRKTPSDTNGTYIPRSESYLPGALAQKEYDRKILQLATEELETISKLLQQYDKGSIQRFYQHLDKPRRDLIQPLILPDDEFIKTWTEKPFTQKSIADCPHDYQTRHGVRVRSKSELLIASTLENSGIPYRYEAALYLKGFGYVYPDFTILNPRLRKEYVWEHLGMMDNPDYIKSTMPKINLYLQNGFIPGDNLILTHESSNDTLKTNLVYKMIELFLT
jgi:hypothetical protein